MKFSIRQIHEKFPEPQFSELQRGVFSGIQLESAAWAVACAAESMATQGTLQITSASHSPMVRFAAYVGKVLVGWSYGWFERGNCFYMANSGVKPEYQRRGIYSALLKAAISHAKQSGAHVVRSQHSVLNNPVIICKLQRGFHMVGLSTSAQMGVLVELQLHLSQPRYEFFKSRVIALAAPP